MRKSYIIWWIISAAALYRVIWIAYHYIFFKEIMNGGDYVMAVLSAIVAGVCFYLGVGSYRKYQEYQEDRKIRNEYLKSNTKKQDESCNDRV